MKTFQKRAIASKVGYLMSDYAWSRKITVGMSIAVNEASKPTRRIS